MSDYDSIETTVDEIVDAAIESAMAYEGWKRDGDEYYSVASANAIPGDQETREFFATRVTGPGSGEVRFVNPGLYGNDMLADLGEQALQAVADLYGKWDSEVHALFDPWTRLPEAENSSPTVAGVIEAARTISLGESIDGGARVPANPELSDLADANGQLDRFTGGTVEAFRRNYSRRLEVAVLPNQCGLVCEIAEGMLTEAGIINEARNSVVKIADATLNSMKKARPAPSGSGSTDAILTVAGVGIAVAGIFATGPAAIFVSGLGITHSLLSSFSGTEKSASLAAETPEDVLERARTELGTLDQDIYDEEALAADKFRDVVSTIDAGGGNYDLREPSALLSSETAQALIDKPDVLQVDADVLRTVGNSHFPGIADQLDAAAVKLDPYGARYEWYRPGTIGYGVTGPSAPLEQACNAVALLIADTAREVRVAGGHLAVAAGFFDSTDAEVRAGFRDHEDTVRDMGPVTLPYDVPQAPHIRHPGLDDVPV